jgi:hypothetical protein
VFEKTTTKLRRLKLKAPILVPGLGAKDTFTVDPEDKNAVLMRAIERDAATVTLVTAAGLVIDVPWAQCNHAWRATKAAAAIPKPAHEIKHAPSLGEAAEQPARADRQKAKKLAAAEKTKAEAAAKAQPAPRVKRLAKGGAAKAPSLDEQAAALSKPGAP